MDPARTAPRRPEKLSRSQKLLVSQVTSLLAASEQTALSLLQTANWDVNAAVDLFFSQRPGPAGSQPAPLVEPARRGSSNRQRREEVPQPFLATPVSRKRQGGSNSVSCTANPASAQAANPSSPILLDDTSDGETPETRTQDTDFDPLSKLDEGGGDPAAVQGRAHTETARERGVAASGRFCRKRHVTEDGVAESGKAQLKEDASRLESRRQWGLAETRFHSGKTAEDVDAQTAPAAVPGCREKESQTISDGPAAKRARPGAEALSWRPRGREVQTAEAEKLLKFLQQKYAWRQQEILRSQSLLSSAGVKADWTTYVGYLTLDATIITAAFTRPLPQPQMRFVGDVRVQLPAARGTFFLPRKAAPKLYRVDPGFDEIREDARKLFAAKKLSGDSGGSARTGKKRTLPALTTLLENLTDASCTLRLLLGEREAGRIQKSLSKELLLLLLLDVIKVHITWVPGAPPAFPLRVGTTVTVAVYVFLTSNLFSLERAKNSVSLDLGGQCSHALATLFQAVRAPMKSRADLVGVLPSAPCPSAAEPAGPGVLTAHRVLDGSASAAGDEDEGGRREEEGHEAEDDSESEDEEALDAGNRLSDLVLGTETALPSCASSSLSAAPPSLRACSASLAPASAPPPACGSVSAGAFASSRGGEVSTRGRLRPSRRVFRTSLRRYQEEGLYWLVSRESRDFDYSAAKKQMDKCKHPDERLAFLPPSWLRLELPSSLPSWLHAPHAASAPSRGSNGGSDRSPFTEKRSGAGGEVLDAREDPFFRWNGDRQNAIRHLFCNFDACAFSLACPTSSKAVTGGILGDAMGLGKTVQLLALVSTDLVPAYDPGGAEGDGAPATGDSRDAQDETEELKGREGPRRRQAAGSRAEAEEKREDERSAGGRATGLSRSTASRQQKPGCEREVCASSSKADECLPLAPPPRPEVIAQHLKPDAEGYYPGGTLIVVPLSLLSQWREEIRTHMQPGVCSVYEYYGAGRNKNPAFLASHTLVLTTYQTLATDFRQAGRRPGLATGCLPSAKASPNAGGASFFSPSSCGDGKEREDRSRNAPGGRNAVASPLHAIFFYRVVLDEGHIIKSAPSSQSQACCAINAERRWMLTGTPLQNDVSDAFALVKFLKIRPMGTAAWWNAHVAQPMERGQTAAAISTVRSILLPLMLRRHANSRGEDGKPILPLPPISFHCFSVCLTPFERALYMAFFTRSREEFERLLKAGVVMTNYSHVLLLLLRLRQLCCHPSLVTARSRDLQERILSGSTEDVDRLLGSLIRRKETGDATAEADRASPLFVSSVVQEVREGRVEDCPICLDFPAEPVLLVSCCHTLCHSCAMNLLRRKRNECPICRRKFERNQVMLLPPPALLSGASAEASKTAELDGEEAQRETAGGVAPTSSADEAGKNGSSASKNEQGREKKDEEFFFSTKLKVAIALVAEDVRQGRSCVIFSQWTSMLDTIERGFAEYERQRRSKEANADQAPILPYRRLDGSMTSSQRQAVLSWFAHSKSAANEPAFWAEQEADGGRGGSKSLSSGPRKSQDRDGGPFAGIFQDLRDAKDGARETAEAATRSETADGRALQRQPGGEGRILLCSLKAGNVGLNLTRASRCYLMDGWWNPQVENQAMKRIWRFGQDKPVKVVRFVCVRTVEERLEEIKEFKGWMARGVCEVGSGVDDVDGQGAPSSGRPESFDEDKQRGRLSIDELKRLFRGFETEELAGAEMHDTRRYPGPALEHLGTDEVGSYSTEGSAESATEASPERPDTGGAQQVRMPSRPAALEAAEASMEKVGSASNSSLQQAHV
uniref:AAR147Wp, related n=1 Tax=Neospora caninum (strain Liverpool) TaxID=572307 RepID=A0A0F7U866_NEOCL|nr:TPA: AAR147Wp, related [Neospora caninum Liverpool]